MSAYMVEDETINALVNWAVQYQGGAQIRYRFAGESIQINHDVERAKMILREQNEQSLLARYGDSGREMFGGPFRSEPFAVQVPIVSLIKACHCYAYQACESADWQASEAFAIVEAIESALVRALPGYGDAPWGLDSSNVNKGAICLSQLIGRKPALRASLEPKAVR